ncbi:MAG: hypothetical protein FWD27_08655 [Coriobacteriia bacterium]|nr:hypothetical protein [Coriobacteriia bacterium]
MGDSFVSADIDKIASFERQSEEAIAEYDLIREKFEKTNTTLLGKWKGGGADAYKLETDHILENVGSIKDILEEINNSVVKDIKENYLALDEALGEFNRDPQASE